MALQLSLVLNEEDNILEKDATMFPSKCTKWIGEPYHNGTLESYQFFGYIIYLLFLRVVKTTKDVITDWINRNKKITPITLWKNTFTEIFHILNLIGVK